MSKDGFDVRKLREFQEALESMKAEAPAIIEEMAVGEGVYAVKQARLICKNEKIVDTGAYRMNFHTGSKARGAWEGSEHDGSAPKKSGNTYIIDVYNNLDYAKHLEYGFRSHWVPAQYLSPRTLAEVYRHRNALAVEAGRKPLDKMPDGMYVGHKGGYVWGVFVMKRAIERTKTTQDARLSRKWNKKVQEYVEGEALTVTVNEMISGIALKLGDLYPDRLVFYKKIEQMSDGNHYVRCINQSHTGKLDRQRSRAYGFEVLYFCKKDDPLEFNAWAETMYLEFETLTVNGHVYHVKNAHAEPGDDMVFHFVFDVEFIALVEPEPIESMGTLTETTEVV